MRKTLTSIMCLVLAVPLFIFSTAESLNAGSAETIVVTGKGYPPIRAENASQARLMARRAAIVDAYRNALAGKTDKIYDDEYLYGRLEGFVKDIRIINEEYLDDGGVRITAEVPESGIIVSSHSVASKKLKKPESGISQVTLEQWYEIIKKFVRFEE